MSATTVVLPRALSRAIGLDLGAYRQDHVAERIRRAQERERVPDVDALVNLLVRDPAARARFRRSIAVSVSGLFRDPEQFELLERTLLPPLVADGRRLTVWSAGCADGSELYSAAIVLDRLGGLENSFLLGSDLLAENLALAERGVYGAEPVPEHVRLRLRWEQRDIVRQGVPPGKWRMVLCRNLAIYLAPGAKQALYGNIAGALAVGGLLMVGRSERLVDPEALGLERVAPHAYRRSA